ncbi:MULTISPECIES: asparagine synthase (glutamine-hydrolyzing) [Haloarcula]|uniref:asparagine synthase (glutamine-hydrolyzing) n=1 Tax=Haloarcula TaxID=2237 RepID=UPI001CDA1FF4|nr:MULTISPECIES: asparagine synthase (glutamine-hydrolyzing) [Haloarcula]
MCGICGQYVRSGSPETDVLERMNDCQCHRGPDDDGVFRDGSVGLAHRRLSIIDPENGGQPIHNEDGTVTVIFNGEIYNYGALKERLTSAGHRFTTQTDTEVLVHLYEEEGPSFVDELDGMFAFALWDSERERLLLARDPMGIKPLVLAETDDKLAFASELPSLFESDIDLGGIDRDALAQYFAFGYIPAPKTAFRNVSKVRPGERILISDDGIDRDKYHEPSITPRDPDIDTAASHLRSLVESAVEKRLMADVDLGAFLSGGIDSTIIVGTMAQLLDDPVKTFTVGFNQDRFDESWAAREVASFHDTDHHEITLTANDVRESVPDVLNKLGEPFADPALMPSYAVSRATRNNVKVALSGDGADELFAGYDKYRVESLSKYYRALPAQIRKYAVEPAVNALPASRGTAVGDAVYKGQWFINRSGERSVPERHFDLMRVSDDQAIQSVTNVDPIEAGQTALRTQHAAISPELADRESLARIQAVDTRLSLPDQMLTKVDQASMYNSLEVRVPFLDTDVVEYALSLPTDHKLTGRDRKRVLKRAFDDVLPESILQRNKHGFDMPIGEWFKHELADEFVSMVRATDLGILDTAAILELFDEHLDGNHDHSRFLWTVYVFKHWAVRMQEQGVLE